MRIVLTNDDGIEAPGIAALYAAVKSLDLGEIEVIAPAAVCSAMSHAVTFHRPIAADRRQIHTNGATFDGDGVTFDGVAVDAKPADCVKLALFHFVKDADLVISGVNAGCNVGIHTIYSGTVGAAREAAIIGVPAIAVSLHLGPERPPRWQRASELAADALGRVLTQPLPAHSLININVPILDGLHEPKGIRVAPMATGRMVDAYDCTEHPSGRVELRAKDHVAFHDAAPDTDVAHLFDRYITITPLTFDGTHHAQLPELAARFA